MLYCLHIRLEAEVVSIIRKILGGLFKFPYQLLGAVYRIMTFLDCAVHFEADRTFTIEVHMNWYLLFALNHPLHQKLGVKQTLNHRHKQYHQWMNWRSRRTTSGNP